MDADIYKAKSGQYSYTYDCFNSHTHASFRRLSHAYTFDIPSLWLVYKYVN